MSNRKHICCNKINAALNGWNCKTAVDAAIKQSLMYPESCPKSDECRANGGEGCTCVKSAEHLPCGCGTPGPLGGIMEAAIPVSKKKTTIVVVDDKKKDNKGSDKDKS
jgi:hypothetical protein